MFLSVENMKEEIKGKLTDLSKTLAIVLGILCFIGMFFIPDNTATIIFLGGIACLHLWVIGKIIARYKNMTRNQRQSVLYYFFFLGLSVILLIMAYNGWFDRWVKDENLSSFLNSLGGCVTGSAWCIGLYACKKDEEE